MIFAYFLGVFLSSVSRATMRTLQSKNFARLKSLANLTNAFSKP